MARVKGTKARKVGSKFLKKGGSKKGKGKSAKIEVSLPTEPEPLSHDLRDFSMLIHGEKKIGKTSMLAQEEMAFFLEFDPKQQGVSIMQRHIPDWPHFMAYIAKLEEQVAKGKCPYKTIIVDGLDLMYRECFKWCCKALVIEHPHDENDYGKSWGFIKENFREAFLLTYPVFFAQFVQARKNIVFFFYNFIYFWIPFKRSLITNGTGCSYFFNKVDFFQPPR